MSLFDIYKVKTLGAGADSLFDAKAGGKLNKDAWKKGFNKWDEEWEVGTLMSGQPVQDQKNIRSKNFCICVPGTSYFCHVGSATTQYFVRVVFYDENEDFISHVWTSNAKFTSPNTAAYFKIHTQDAAGNSYGNEYKDDICINISGEHDGEYVPYNG